MAASNGKFLQKLKSSYRESSDTAINSISAMKTVLEEYPIVITDDSINGDSSKSSISFMLNILKMLGVTETEIIDKVCDWLCGNDKDGGNGKKKDGFLDYVEYAVKGIVLANIKNMLTCSMNPLIPDRLLYPAENIEEKGGSRNVPVYPGGNGVSMKISDIDLFDTLQLCPVSEEGKRFYFDAHEPIYNQYRDKDKNGKLELAPYSANYLWASCDFDAYLWYVIHREGGSKLRRPFFWDNRCKYYKKELANNDDIRAEFFNEGEQGLANMEEKYHDITEKGETVRQYGIIITRFEELPPNFNEREWDPKNGSTALKNLNTNAIRCFINPWRYGRRCFRIPINKKNDDYITVWMNSTIFEFNFEYVWYMKLFDTKTLVARIIHALYNTINATEYTISIEEELIKGEVRQLVEDVMTADDTEIDDCFLRFSNRDYETMLEEARRRYNGRIRIAYDEDAVSNEVDMDEINRLMDALDTETTPEGKSKILKNIFKTFTLTGTATEDELKDNIKFSFANTIIQRLINELSVQLVLSILSPKFAVLYKINSEVMGDVTEWNEDEKFKFDGWGDFLKNFKNMLFDIIKEIKEIVVTMLKDFLMQELRPLLEMYALILIKEVINDYRMLIQNVIENCTLNFGLFGWLRNKYSNLIIDNVAYADIDANIEKEAIPPNKDTNSACSTTEEI